MEQRLIRTEVLGTALELEAHDGLFRRGTSTAARWRCSPSCRPSRACA